MVCARTRAVERHTYEDIDAYGFSDASVGAVRARAGFPIKVDDQIVVADSEPLGEHPAGGLDAYLPVTAGLIARPTRYRFPVHVSVHSCLAKIAGRTLKSPQARRQELMGAMYFQLFHAKIMRGVATR
jgi:hypothetical protein